MQLALAHCHSYRLELSSEYFESVLVRTEAALRKHGPAARAIELIAGDYESVMDCLLGSCSPEWGKEIAAYYRGEGPQMIEGHSAEVIAAVDHALVPVVKGLSRAIAEIGEWPDDVYYRDVLRGALRELVSVPRP